MTDLTRPLAKRVQKLPAPEKWHEGLPEPDSVAEGAIRALDEKKTSYTTRPGIIPLREQVAARLNARYNLDLKVDDITITCGTTEAEYVPLAYFVSQTPGKIITADHTDDEIFVEHLDPIAHLLGTSVISYSMDLQRYMAHLMQGRREPEPDDFIVPEDDLAVVYIGNPGAKAKALLQLAQERDLTVVWSTYMDLNDAGISQMPDLIPKTVLVGGLESGMAGWRIGWMAGHQDHARLRSYKQSMTICSPSISQWAALAMMEAES